MKFRGDYLFVAMSFILANVIYSYYNVVDKDRIKKQKLNSKYP